MNQEDFRQRYQSLKTPALLRIVTLEKNQYQMDAVKAAMEVLGEQGYPLSKNIDNCKSLDEGKFRDFKEAIVLRLEDGEDIEVIFNDIFNFGYNPFFFFRLTNEIFPPPTFKMTEEELLWLRTEIKKWGNESEAVEWVLIGLPIAVFFILIVRGSNVGVVLIVTFIFGVISYVASQIKGPRTPREILNKLDQDLKDGWKILIEGKLESVTVIDNKSKGKLEAVKEVLAANAFDHVIDKQSLLLSIETEYEFVEVECTFAKYPMHVMTGDRVKIEVTKNARMVLNFV